MNKSALAFLVVGFLIGVVAGYVAGMSVYQSQISQLQSDLSDTQGSLSAAQTQVTNLQSDLATAEETISGLESQVADLLSRITPETGYETVLMYGFSLEYPEYLYVSVSGVLSTSGANEHSGMFVAQKPDETEAIIAIWIDTTYPRDLDDALNMGITGTPNVISTGDRVTSTINGHIIKYQSLTAVIEGTTYNIVMSYWNCDSTKRVYGVEYMTVEEDAIPGFLQCLASFICH